MDHFAMLTFHKQLVETALHKVSVFRNVLSRIYGHQQYSYWLCSVENWIHLFRHLSKV